MSGLDAAKLDIPLPTCWGDIQHAVGRRYGLPAIGLLLHIFASTFRVKPNGAVIRLTSWVALSDAEAARHARCTVSQARNALRGLETLGLIESTRLERQIRYRLGPFSNWRDVAADGESSPL